MFERTDDTGGVIKVGIISKLAHTLLRPRWLLVFAVLASNQAQAAFTFTLEKHEWMTWPEHCRVRYVFSDAGKNSDYSRAYTEKEVRRWSGIIGEEIWAHMHHACAGYLWLRRAKNTPPGQQRDFMLDKAVSNHSYTLKLAPNQNKWYAWFAVSLAEVYRELEEYDAAIELNSKMAEAYPDYDKPYLAWSLVLRDQQKYGEAIEVLQTALEKTDGTSAELWYFLGLTYTDAKRYAEALKPAQEAYRLGYPLPGLRDRLKRAGVWQDPVKTADASVKTD